MDPGLEHWKCKSDKPLEEFMELGKKWETDNPYHFGVVSFQNGVDEWY